MYDIFEQLLQKRGITPYRVSKDTGVTQTALSNWKTGKSVPTTKTLQKIADYFGVTIDYLMTGETREEDHYQDLIDQAKSYAIELLGNGFNDGEISHFEKYIKLSSDNRKKVDFYMDSLLSLQQLEENVHEAVAAHERTDISKNNEEIKEDLNVFDDGNWE